MPRTAFSLVETVLAVGITAVAIIPLLALMALGVEVNGDSREEATITHILTEIARDLDSTSFDDLPAAVAYSFDQDGFPVPDNDPERLYRAQVTIDRDAQLPGDAVPGQNLAHVLVTVMQDPTGAPDSVLFTPGPAAADVVRRSFFVARHD